MLIVNVVKKIYNNVNDNIKRKSDILSTIKMVAKEAGVSTMTVSRVLNQSQPVREETKKRVMAAVKKLDYQPNQAARIMRGGKANILGVLIPDFTNPFYAEFLKYIEEAAAKYGFRLLITSNNATNNQIDNVQYLINRNVDAIIVCSYNKIKNAAQYLSNNYPDIPMVVLDKLERGINMNSVYADGFIGIKNVVEYLIKEGHKKIAMIKGNTNHLIANDRYLGYEETLKSHGIEVRNDYIYEGDYTMQTGVAAVEYFLSLKDKPTVIVSSSDYIAIGAIHQLIQRGYRVPEDFSVTGYDGIYMGEISHPQLTTIKIPISDMAQKTVQILMDDMNTADIKKNEKITVRYIGDLCIKGSTGKFKDK